MSPSSATSPPSRPPSGPPSRQSNLVTNLYGIVDGSADPTSSRIGLGALSDHAGSSGPGLILLLLGLAMLIPGPAPVFGGATCIISIGLMIRGDHLWMPDFLRRRSMARHDINAVLKRLERPLNWLGRHSRPGWLWAMDGIWQKLTGLACLSNAILIILPIPLGNMLPASALLVSATGVFVRDGRWIAVGWIMALVALVADIALVMLGYTAILHLIGLAS
ncbi:exopolysaccharide biosynthesis protein [Granulibacter bethesdensis]|uniref:Exopolysaccharide synthesis protein n=1 Tax=Granulibacter bethesdensis (strain ATCC BAA-1260 / CGDNIH1) TaxID=391165 RepID=Q0BTV9_GRABC|nr:exopolysaccharide biosynthesis protein [Granulibacter bethesdensis]ABI61743.1 Exopolysaccharide synthesis protein [Granulibacter bethesdensis CGDNIH1]AHJ69436.1 Exopolysaccharide synthesis protein [Granulibacter bethesdensis]APH51551.1 Exopolysaccharide synthesis protein [Granulibacter bethesdensis]APH64244.1 Exopolysaccharide synthesis protein [Granulibacter bethesdensis]